MGALSTWCAQGLVTPVVRGVERMTYADIERTIANLSNKVRNVVGL